MTFIDAELMSTEGLNLEAEVLIAGVRLTVMDGFSGPGERSSCGLLQNVRLDCLEADRLSFEEMFQGNPHGLKGLEWRGGWRYAGYGQIIGLNPTRVDFGLAIIDGVGPRTNDASCVGQFIKVEIDRLELLADEGALR